MAFIREFLFGASPVRSEGRRVSVDVFVDRRMEGWIGIPHGGIGMGAVVELASRLDNHPVDDRALYPLSMEFRMGGSSLRVGDTVTMEANATDGGPPERFSSVARGRLTCRPPFSTGKTTPEGLTPFFPICPVRFGNREKDPSSFPTTGTVSSAAPIADSPG